jgi:hypothetical protein
MVQLRYLVYKHIDISEAVIVGRAGQSNELSHKRHEELPAKIESVLHHD